MSNTIQTYQNLVTSEYQNQPNFQATIALSVGMSVQVQALLASMMTTIFDLDSPPVGNQLDIIGQWVGVSRSVAIPIAGVYFSWDDTKFDGWDFGNWRPGNAPTTITVLPDGAYLTLIRARIAANQWDGTTEGAYAIWEKVFPTFAILVIDHCNMTYDLAIVGGIVDSLTLALITGGYIPLRPEGVLINEYLVSVDTNKAFAWDVENTYLAGWNEGSWLRALAPT
jgi:hypothetical protein